MNAGLSCASCGAPLPENRRKCDYCHTVARADFGEVAYQQTAVLERQVRSLDRMTAFMQLPELRRESQRIGGSLEVARDTAQASQLAIDEAKPEVSKTAKRESFILWVLRLSIALFILGFVISALAGLNTGWLIVSGII